MLSYYDCVCYCFISGGGGDDDDDDDTDDVFNQQPWG